MALKIGIVGLPNVGKSTLFKALTKNNVLIANYPFATIEPNTGVVPVPDERLNKLSAMYQPEKTLPATVQFVDIAGLVAGAHKGEGLGNKFLAHIRQSEVICLVVRVFEDADVTHVAGQLDPARDIEIIKTELMLADLETLQTSLNRWQKLAKGEPKLKNDVATLQNVIAQLDQGQWPTSFSFEHPELAGLTNSLLTTKALIYVFNVNEPALKDAQLRGQLTKLIAPHEPIFISAKLEAELAELSEADAKELLTSVGLAQSGLETLIRVGYETLGLQTFFTAGPQEVRAWTVNKGAKAPEAAGKIHTDFERGFIATDVVGYADLMAAGSLAAAKAAGKLRSEGKNYVVQDGDVMEFKFNL